MQKPNDQAADAPRPFYYRNDLFRDAPKAKQAIRTLAMLSGLSLRTWQIIFAGDPVNQKTLRQAADYLGLDWTEIHTPKK